MAVMVRDAALAGVLKGTRELDAAIAMQRGLVMGLFGWLAFWLALLSILPGGGLGPAFAVAIVAGGGLAGWWWSAGSTVEGTPRLVLDRDTLHFKQSVSVRYAQLIYDGLWFSALHRDLRGYVASSQRVVSGEVRMRLDHGTAVIAGDVVYFVTYSAESDPGEQEKASGHGSTRRGCPAAEVIQHRIPGIDHPQAQVAAVGVVRPPRDAAAG